ncbi:hypothetical protein FCIRC_10004 [Fusarium circinatum]|uniref:RING-type domain-containing protein n=1 Tax=Fusarium circinatum TaxID=48490 RepID=A0A8H5T786_FUSCI|nr:hypothetical protein FCIRC_10004 [Fusarium circinatum]
MNTFKNIAKKLKELFTNPTPNYKPVNRANNKVLDAGTENFWPNIRKHILADDPNSTPMKAICATCRDEVHVTCISSPGDKIDIGLVAPCGHIMCSGCWPRKVIDDSESSKDYEDSDDSCYSSFPNARRCPICYIKLECFYCERSCDKEVIPTSGGKASIESFPKTAPELGRKYVHFCRRKDCYPVDDVNADGFWFQNVEKEKNMYSLWD